MKISQFALCVGFGFFVSGSHLGLAAPRAKAPDSLEFSVVQKDGNSTLKSSRVTLVSGLQATALDPLLFVGDSAELKPDSEGRFDKKHLQDRARCLNLQLEQWRLALKRKSELNSFLVQDLEVVDILLQTVVSSDKKVDESQLPIGKISLHYDSESELANLSMMISITREMKCQILEAAEILADLEKLSERWNKVTNRKLLEVLWEAKHDYLSAKRFYLERKQVLDQYHRGLEGPVRSRK